MLENLSLSVFAPGALLPQQIYRLKHAHLGEMDLFLVPVGRTNQGFTYEAFFNRLVGAPGGGGESR